MIKNEKIFVGIDPDVDGSGVAVLDPETKGLVLSNLRLPDLIRFFQQIEQKMAAGLTKPHVFVIEAGFMNETNWHIQKIRWKKFRDPLAAAAETGRRTGLNHQIAHDIIDIAKGLGLTVVERAPLEKGWSGKDRKITHEEFAYLTGITQKRSNQEERDAGLLAWYESGLPMRVKIGNRSAK